jgi:putative transposase
MARIARVVAPGYPHHVTQRGNRRQRTFFADDDYRAYLGLMAEWCGRCGVEVWAYCLMPNHVHLVVVPSTEAGLAGGIGEAHRRYTRRINFGKGWRGHLWQGRFSSYVMDEAHLLAAVRYVENNPVRARLCRRPWRYPWSSAAAHVAGQDDVLVKVAPMLEIAAQRMPDWKAYLALETPAETAGRLRLHERTMRPLGDEGFITELEALLGRRLRPGKPGRPRKKAEKTP